MRWNKGLVFIVSILLVALPAVGFANSPVSNPSDKDAGHGKLLEHSIVRIVRGLEEPLVAIRPILKDETKALDAAVSAYLSVASSGDLSPLQQYVDQHREAAWRVSMLVNLGIAYYHQGYFTRAIKTWRNAWVDGRQLTEPKIKAQVDRAVGELARMHARVGRSAELSDLFDEIGDRPISGPATEMITGAREALWMFTNEPGIAFLCGPMAMKNLLITLGASPEAIELMDEQRSGPNGFSLEELALLAETIDLDYRLVYRKPGEPVPVPSIVNWKLNHYAAIVDEIEGRYLIQDPTFGSGDFWMTQEAVNQEASGYFLVPTDIEEKNDWRSVSLAEAREVYGMGVTSENQPGATTPNDTGINNDPGCGMCVVDAKTMVVSLSLKDSPVGYSPPVGPSPRIQLTYNQREANQPAVFGFFNVSPKWNLNFMSWVRDDPGFAGYQVMRHVAGGGSINYSPPYNTFDSVSGEFSPEKQSQSVLVRIPASGPLESYELRMPDGSKQVFAKSDGVEIFPRRMFLTELVDAAGNALTLNYDNQLRLISLTDATGRDTTFSYELLSLPLLITRITDPFGRSAELAYDELGRLSSITDVIGLTSEFDYDEAGLVDAMTTPYGAHSFVYGDEQGNTRFLEMTDPLGFTERIEFRHVAPGIPASELVVPLDVPIGNQFLNYRNTFYWDKTTYPLANNDYTQAEITHWLHNPERQTSPIIESTKMPLESRVWRTYPGQSGSFLGLFEGTTGTPSTVSRILDDEGATQTKQLTYNAFGKPLVVTDPLGRTTRFTYADNEIDVIQIEQLTDDELDEGSYSTIATLTYNTRHQPLTYTDAAGQTSQFTYNAAGQLTSETNPLGERTAYEYDDLGYLNRIIDANDQTRTTITYDTFGRIYSHTDSQGYVITYEYDAMDRVVRTGFPDGTSQTYEWDRLDLISVTDRLGRVTRYDYDDGRRLISMTDSLGQTTRYNYNRNGELISLIDPKGQTTSWQRDLQGRVTAKLYADGSMTQYAYESETGRLQSTTDALGQVKSISYAIDNRPAAIAYTNSVLSTPNVIFSWDRFFPRLVSIEDGTGITTYDYGAIGELGANQLTSVTSPVEGKSGLTDTVSYSYDALGRENQRDINGSVETYAFDTISRLTSVENPLGAFTYIYSDSTSRVSGIEASRGPQVSLNYYDSENDQLLSDITYTASAGTQLSKFGYQYNASNNVTEFTQRHVSQQLDVASVTPFNNWGGQTRPDVALGTIANASVISPGNLKTPLAIFFTALSIAFTTLVATRRLQVPNSQLLRQSCVLLCVTSVSVLVMAACSSDSDSTPGNNGANDGIDLLMNDDLILRNTNSRYDYDELERLVSVTQTDDNEDTSLLHRYEYDEASNITRIESSDSDRKFSHTSTNAIDSGEYNANGSPISLDGASYTWDAENRLVSWSSGSKESSFTYDGQSRLVRIVDREAGTIVNDRSYTWCGLRRCIEHDNLQVDSPISKVYFDQGTLTEGAATYHVVDQLGSVRQIVDENGSVISQYDYDAYGNETSSAGPVDGEIGYAGLFKHAASGLHFAAYRAFSSKDSRWLNRDPIGENGGTNLYEYANSNPVSYADSTGLSGESVRGFTFSFRNPIAQTDVPGVIEDKTKVFIAGQIAKKAFNVPTPSRLAAGFLVSKFQNKVDRDSALLLEAYIRYKFDNKVGVSCLPGDGYCSIIPMHPTVLDEGQPMVQGINNGGDCAAFSVPRSRPEIYDEVRCLGGICNVELIR